MSVEEGPAAKSMVVNVINKVEGLFRRKESTELEKNENNKDVKDDDCLLYTSDAADE